MKKVSYIFSLFSLGISLFPLQLIFANDTNVTLTTLIDDLIGITNRLVVLLLGVALIVFIWSLIRFLATADDAAARTEWRGYMIYAVIAFAVISGLWGIVNATLDLLGLSGGGIPQFSTSNH